MTFVEASSRYPWLQEAKFEAEQAQIESLRARVGTTCVTDDDVSDLMNAVREVPGTETWLKPIVDADPDDLFAAGLLAERMLVIAWDRRSHARGKDLTPEQVRGFRETLLELENFLHDRIAHHPKYVPFWNARITSGMGMEVGRSEITRRYRRLEMLSPDFYHAAFRHMIALLPKWYGTYEDSLAFCRAKAASAPMGSLMKALPVDFYIEQLGWEPNDEMIAKLKTPEVHAELVEASQGSVLAPGHRQCPDTLQIHSNLALLLGRGGWWEDAWPHFRALGPYPVKAGWAILQNPEQAYQTYFDAAQKAVRA